MDNFIQIGDRLINKAHIVQISMGEFSPDMGKPYPYLLITLTSSRPGDHGQYPEKIGYTREEAVRLWEQLQHYLSPTVL
jgi:hypothetical protein